MASFAPVDVICLAPVSRLRVPEVGPAERPRHHARGLRGLWASTGGAL